MQHKVIPCFCCKLNTRQWWGLCWLHITRASLVAQTTKNQYGKCGFSPWIGKIPWEGNSYPLQCSGLENSMDRGAWQVTVHGVTKSWTWLRNFHFQDGYKTLFFINIKKVPLHKSIWRCLLLNFQNMVKYVHFLQTY